MSGYPKALRSPLLSVYAWLILIVFGGVIVTAPLTVWLGTIWPDISLPIKAWKEVLMVIAFFLAIILVTRRKMWNELLRDRVIRLIIVFTLLHIFLIGYHFQGIVAVTAGLMIDLRYLLFFVLVYILVKLAPWYRLNVLMVGAIGALVVIGFGVMQWFLPRDFLAYIGYSHETIEPYLTVDKNPDFVRHSSTLRGPNPLGAYLAIVLALMVSAGMRYQSQVLRDRKRCIAFIAAAIAAGGVLWGTYSRSAVVAAMGGIILTVLIARGKWLLAHRQWVYGPIVGVLVAALIIMPFTDKLQPFISNVILHDNPTTGGEITSDQAHASSLQHGIQVMTSQPLGRGIGSTGSASLHGKEPTIIENQYLFVAHEVGWLGVGIYLVIIGLVLIRLYKKRADWLSLGLFTSGVALAFIGILLPVWVDDTVAIVWWGLAGLALGSSNISTKKVRK